MATSEHSEINVELNEDKQSDSNSKKTPNKKKRCQLQKKFPFASFRVVGRCLHKSLPARREILLPIVAFVPVTSLFHMED